MPEVLKNLSVIDPPFLLGLGLVTTVALAATWFHLRHRWLRVALRSLSVCSVILLAGAAVNARYAYLPTIAAVFGRTSVEQVSPSELRALELGSGRRHDSLHRNGVRLALGPPATDIPQHGVVVPFTIPATQSHFHARTAEVYLPPAYFETPRPQLPVIELLHGSPGSPADWTRAADADITSDEYASQHEGFAPLLVMPDVNGNWYTDSECVNGAHGQAQTYLTVDVRNAVIARFHTRRDRRGWAIAGLSEGAYCAIQIGLRNPLLYGSIGDFSGERGPNVRGGLTRLFGGTQQQADADALAYDPVDLLTNWTGRVRPSIWFEVGSDDITLPNVVKLDQLALSDGFDTRFVVQKGADHSFGSWRDSFRDSLPWFADSFGTTGATVTTATPGGD